MSGRWPRKVITDELLSRASQGSPADLFSVCKALIDGEFTPEVVQLPALFLKADLIPRVEQQDPQEIQDRMKRAATSISMLASILRAAKEEPDIVEGLIAWALESVDGICGWARLLLLVPDVDPYWKDDLVAAHYRSAVALNLLLHLDPKVYGAFISSNIFIDLAIQVWVREGPEKELLMGAENGSVIPPFLSYCLSKKEGVDALAERLIDRRLTERFVSAVVRRMRQASLVNLSSTTPEQISEYVTYINTMTARLHGFKNDTIQKTFRTTNCIKNVFSSLNDLSIVLERHNPKKLPLLAVPIFTLTAITVFERTRAVHNWRDFIAGNLLSMLSRIAPAIPQSDVKNTKIICSTLRNLSACAYFPVFLATLAEAVPSGRVECPPLCNETIDYWWGTVWDDKSLAPRVDLYRSIQDAPVVICDNLQCNRKSGSCKAPSRQCSGCSSALYCSIECQKEDWDNLHHAECIYARREHDGRLAARNRYSPATRNFQTTWVETLYNNQSDMLTRSVLRMNPGYSLHDLVTVLDCSEGPFDMGSHRLDDEGWWAGPWWDEEMHTSFETQSYLKPRFAHAVRNYMSREMREDHQIVEACFYHCSRRVIALMVVLKRIEGKYEAVYSIPRFGEVIDKPK